MCKFAELNPGSGSLSDVVASLVSAATTSMNATFGENAAAYNAFNTHLPGFVNSVSYNTGVPKAYLNYILFDASYTGTPQFGYVPVPISAATRWEKLSIEIPVPAGFNGGHAYIYVTNESNFNVFFDDFLIVHEKSPMALRVTESADYYPFGLVIEGTRYVDESRKVNSYGYQGDYAEFDARTGWNRFALRGNYDSRLGRWQSGDPYSQYVSPYVGMGNAPLLGVDADGGYFSIGAAIVGVLGGGVVGGGLGYLVDRDNWGMWAIGGALIGGAVMGFTGADLVYTNPEALNGLDKTWAQMKSVFSKGHKGYVNGNIRVGFHPYGNHEGGSIGKMLDEVVVEGRRSVEPIFTPSEIALRKVNPTIGPISPKLRPNPILSPYISGVPRTFPVRPFNSNAPTLDPRNMGATRRELGNLINYLSSSPGSTAAINLTTPLPASASFTNGANVGQVMTERIRNLRQLIRQLGPGVNSRIIINPPTFGTQMGVAPTPTMTITVNPIR